MRVVAEVVAPPCDAVVEQLTSLLADARAGKITALAVASLNDKGWGCHAFAWQGKTNWVTLLGAIQRMQLALVRHFDERRR